MLYYSSERLELALGITLPTTNEMHISCSCLGIPWAPIRYPCLRSCVRRSSLLSSTSGTAPAIRVSQTPAWVSDRIVRPYNNNADLTKSS